MWFLLLVGLAWAAQAQPANLGGLWHLHLDRTNAVLQLQQKGTALSGDYYDAETQERGILSGTVTGPQVTLTRTWAGRRQLFELTLSEDGQSLSGGGVTIVRAGPAVTSLAGVWRASDRTATLTLRQQGPRLFGELAQGGRSVSVTGAWEAQQVLLTAGSRHYRFQLSPDARRLESAELVLTR